MHDRRIPTNRPRAGHNRRALTILAGLALLGNLGVFLRILPNRWKIRKLSEVTIRATVGADELPRLSVIVPARNEAAGLPAGVESLLAQDYPNLELVLVDDRSTDDTGRLMARFAATHPERVRVVTVEALPPDWLGKNHALWLGARHASGEWLIFTDADVIFERTCLRRAVTYASAAGADHLALFPQIAVPGYWLNALIGFFVYAFLVAQQPYLANDPRSKVGVGLGAFNLLRRSAYETMGTHAAIALRPDDDMRLGMRVKRVGLRQRALSGWDLLRVPWYRSVDETIRGLEKNLFAAFDYNPALMVGGILGGGFLTLFPYLALWPGAGRARRLLAAAVAVHSVNYVYANGQAGPGAARYVPALPVSSALFCYAGVRSAWLALTRGGIRWRDTFYPLAQLRGHTGLE